ncbi:S8 family serine peptidase [Chondromyces crocatus]|uniref:Peptidase S8/S53 domain-containing protein n=1 Tax=Chondromyces crocatus TaxID=52 RepID=A0A0K1EG86_CHOCO|nr:S8 family serine peptidase [Chondromyces crocatus]AKT39578.1 uncharacterized protein CMC5_037270 [Chondromyces crocatus]
MSDERARTARPPWDFGYAPLPPSTGDEEPLPLDAVLALSRAVDPDLLAARLRPLASDLSVEPLVERMPLFWYRARASTTVPLIAVERALLSSEISLRYVASAVRSSFAVAPAFGPGTVAPVLGLLERRGRRWAARRPSRGEDPETPGRWFLRHEEGGLGVDRGRFGGGAGTRLAVIDDDGAGVDRISLDGEVLVLVERASQGTMHGALMVAWAIGSGQRADDFRGVAPDASPRLYFIPKPGTSVLALPLAIARAVLDGADVILCATYLEGCSSPLLDDALDFAWRWGRKGRGTPVVIPTGREASSPAGSLHASFSLGLGEPASDPRVFCIGPSARGGGWFLWRDRRGRSRPFANRGPAVRWLAPGDDMAFPLERRLAGSRARPAERLYHAESSGASALAAGALLLVLAQNPALRVEELDAIMTWTLEPVSTDLPPHVLPLADPDDVLPAGRDGDGHNAKHGYGQIHAGRACLVAGDPVALALQRMGEVAAAVMWSDLRRTAPVIQSLYSRRLARWSVRALIADASLLHDVCVLLRHARLTAGNPERRRAHGAGALLRALALLLRKLSSCRCVPRPGPRVSAELNALLSRAERATRGPVEQMDTIESAVADLAGQIGHR